MKQERRRLRRKLRLRRRALSGRQQREAARRLAHQLTRLASQSRFRHVGIYLPNDGEIDLRPFVSEARRRGIHVYLPVLHPILGNLLWFFRYEPDTRLIPNHLGIPEPRRAENQRRPAWALDAVFMPLVGFDHRGERLGMGGGFYDRTFGFKKVEPNRPPVLIGVAHDCQEMDTLPTQPWDVPLNRIVTPTRRVDPKNHRIEGPESGAITRWFGRACIPESRQGRLRLKR
ncbi:5-formyltetrahydrofolate cyclo-ligase [Tamilnaduibacter salinus]|uniref:5-formyltetrahydrofolate cyclo-ligase n=1 Tax=Tamilnaduibacter salinus TaxID=1484056 RepID=A0A2U1CWY8_9GAMM|nr:5-formyltetrahydrofolate cyclo-ligase [Tamilnaduibacter salinus]PVY76509.1 5-formyltetrahydrofolate cyclo-ligase [Tamilnaduibacter salinus]